MAAAVARYLRPAAREVAVDGHRFDVVAYNKREKFFKLVECKRGSRATGIGRAFGQLVAYYSVVSARGFDFVNAVSKKIPINFKRLMEATDRGRRIRVAFYVALTDDDALHVALATVGRADVIVSWNFRHIVNLGRIRLFHSANLERGYGLIEIRSPREVLEYD